MLTSANCGVCRWPEFSTRGVTPAGPWRGCWTRPSGRRTAGWSTSASSWSWRRSPASWTASAPGAPSGDQTSSCLSPLCGAQEPAAGGDGGRAAAGQPQPGDLGGQGPARPAGHRAVARQGRAALQIHRGQGA